MHEMLYNYKNLGKVAIDGIMGLAKYKPWWTLALPVHLGMQ